MNTFNDFLKYKSEHIEEVAYDTIATLRNEWKSTLTLSQDDIALVTKIANQSCLALLRQYHNWLQSQEEFD